MASDENISCHIGSSGCKPAYALKENVVSKTLFHLNHTELARNSDVSKKIVKFT